MSRSQRLILALAVLTTALVGIVPGRAQTLAQFHTPVGDMLVELYDQEKPVTVQNFLRYVNSDRYNDMYMHRWVPGFVVQGGGFITTNRHTAVATLAPLPVFPAITNEYSVGRTFGNQFGSIAMARVGGLTNSATSQWFFNLGNNSGLDTVDGGFTVFGQVRAGTNVLTRFNTVTVANGIYALNLGSPLDQLPVLSQTPGYEDLIYTKITLQSRPVVGISARLDGARIVRWNSLSNLVNIVEMAPQISGAWSTLVSTNGTGASMETVDTTPGAGPRFYRVRIQ